MKKVILLSLFLGVLVLTSACTTEIEPKNFKSVENEKIESENVVEDWVEFDSTIDALLEVHFTMKHPADWYQAGKIKTEGVEIVPFFRKDDYPEEFEKKEMPQTSDYAAVASLALSEVGTPLPDRIFANEKRKEIEIDGRKALMITGENENTELDQATLIVYNIEGTQSEKKLEFSMIVLTEERQNFFDEIVKTIKFN